VTDAAVVGRLLDEYHERRVAPAQIRVLAGSEHQARVSYLITQPDGTKQVIRAFRADEPVPACRRSAGGEIVADWLAGRARTLALLAEAAYPAPRPVRTRTGELIGVAGVWLTWATTFAPGPVAEPTLGQLRLLGAALGHLHLIAAVPGVVRIGDGPPGLAPRHPAAAVPASRARLDRVTRDAMPAAWRPMHAQARAVLDEVAAAAGTVPETIVHGNVWARNVVQSSPSAVTLVGWQTCGLGLAVLDLGNALTECHRDSAVPDDQPERSLITPSPERIAALAAGYASVRRPSAAELDLLPAAAAFAAAVIGSEHLELALAGGVAGAVVEARLAWLQNRLSVAGEVAAIARDSLTG
jgi:Ser/Thr protein kinase RdoA (MazF antagonist)